METPATAGGAARLAWNISNKNFRTHAEYISIRNSMRLVQIVFATLLGTMLAQAATLPDPLPAPNSKEQQEQAKEGQRQRRQDATTRPKS